MALGCKTLGFELWMLALFMCITVCLWKYVYLVRGSLSFEEQKLIQSVTLSRKQASHVKSINLAYIKTRHHWAFFFWIASSVLPGSCLRSWCVLVWGPLWKITDRLCARLEIQVQGHACPGFFTLWTEQCSIKSSCVKPQTHLAIWTLSS